MSNQKLSILLADNNQSTVSLFNHFITLLNLNCDLVIISNGNTFINYIDSVETIPNYIFLDINFPDINGLKCLQYLKTKHPSNTFYVIMTTNNFCQLTSNACYRYGANGIIDKDIDKEFFISLLDYCFKKMPKSVLEKEFVLNKIVVKQLKTQFNK